VQEARESNNCPAAGLFQVGDARALPVANGGFDVAVAGLVLNFVRDFR